MAWFRRRRVSDSSADPTPGKPPVTVAVRDPSLRRDVPLPRQGLLIGGQRMPPITEASETDMFVAMTRRSMPAVRGTVKAVAFPNHALEGQLDAPRYIGLGGRAAAVLCLAEKTRPDLSSLYASLKAKDPVLFLQAHRAGEHGLLRAVLVLADEGLAFDSPMSLASGDVQEFLAAVYVNETINLHLSHQTADQLLGIAYHSPGIRTVLDPVLRTLAGLAQVSTAAGEAEPLAQFRAQVHDVGDGLSPESAIRLEYAGTAKSAILLTLTL